LGGREVGGRLKKGGVNACRNIRGGVKGGRDQPPRGEKKGVPGQGKKEIIQRPQEKEKIGWGEMNRGGKKVAERMGKGNPSSRERRGLKKATDK